jgi:hypothetical protein
MSYFDVANGSGNQDRTNEYRYYKCIQNTCNKVSKPANDTINIPPYIPVVFDKLLIRYTLKTFFPITIRC